MRTSRSLAVLTACCGCLLFTPTGEVQSLMSMTSVQRAFTNEQEWIVCDVVTTVAAIANAHGNEASPVRTRELPARAVGTNDTAAFAITIGTAEPPIHVTVVDHIWSPETYRPVVTRLLKTATETSASADTADLDVRNPLTNLTTPTLIEQSDRISAYLAENPTAPGAHEAAALVVGAFALREASSWFNDVRPALSRMAAHLAVAEALRSGREASSDGMLARATMMALTGRQRDALAVIDAFERRAASDSDRAWAHALRLRVTGDWRKARPDETTLEQLEHARALRERLGVDAFLDYVDGASASHPSDWEHIAFITGLNIEAGNRFATDSIEEELLEAGRVWSHFHDGTPVFEEVVHDLNARPGSMGAVPRGAAAVQVLDWGMWAGYHQRHLAQALIASAYHSFNLGAGVSRDELESSYDEAFGELSLYPVVRRWLAGSQTDYLQAMVRAKRLVESAPELVTQSAWTLLLTKPPFSNSVSVFPLDIAWFRSAVPAGTAFDLGARALISGCPRPPTREQIAAWAAQAPYDHWVVWSNQWLSVDGKPSFANVRRALGPLLDYDAEALRKMLDFMEMKSEQRLQFATTLCGLSAGNCDRLGELSLIADRHAGALTAYERWAKGTRDRVSVANGSTWLMRYYVAHGDVDRAEALAHAAEETGAARGMEVRGEFLDRLGRHEEADRIYREIFARYPDSGVHLGVFLMRTALASENRDLQLEAGAYLRHVFPRGLEPFVAHALPVAPGDGVAFGTFGSRLAAMGLRPTDVIVGVDGWQVHNAQQYVTISRLSFADTMTMHVWRAGKYETIRAGVPERWLGARLRDYRPPAPALLGR